MNIIRFLQKSASTLLLTSLIILPVFFLPLTRDFYDTNKWMLLVGTSLLVLLMWGARLFVTGTAHVSWSRSTIGLGLLAAAALFSLTCSSVNKIEGLLSPLGPVTFVASTILLFFGPSLIDAKQKIILRLGLAVSAGLAGLFVLYQQIGLGTLFFPIGSPFADPFFTPLGSTVGLLMFFCLTLPISISIALGALKEQKEVIAAISVVTAGLTLLGIGITLWKFIPIASSQLLPLPLGGLLTFWSWDTFSHALFGIGPERFFEIFTLYRTQSLNMSPIWNRGFHANASFILHIASTMGILGLLSFLVFSLLLWIDWAKHPITAIQALMIIALSIFAPPTLVLVIVCICLIFSTDTHNGIRERVAGIPRFGIGLLLCILAIASFYGLFRWYRGEELLFQSLKTAENGNGTETFMLVEEAVKTNPTNPAFHIAMSQTALSLAESIIRSAPVLESGKSDMSNEDKTLLTNLISRSIQEAKLAITLSPNNVEMWLNMARIYQGVIGIAKDADVWAIAAFQKAITLDPTNPVLHLNLGGLYMTMNKEEDAGKEFITAINMKPNYIDAFYNLANVFRKKSDWDNAVKALEQTKFLVAKGSTDETKIEQEIISVLEEKKAKGTTAPPTSLYVPQLNLPK